jgi:outer membrane lipoprotein LolB
MDEGAQIVNVIKPLITACCCVLVACTTYKKPSEIPICEQIKPSAKIVETQDENVNTVMSSTRKMIGTTGKRTIIAPGKGKVGAIAKITSWEISGGLAARNQKKSYTASINWVQRGAEHYQIRLIGPLGGGTVVIEKQNGVVRFRDGSKRIESANADKLLLTQTGIRLPVHNLYYWVRGFPAPSGNASTSSTNPEFQQGGYTVTYLEYANRGGMRLPTKIRVAGNGLLMKLVIKRWKI